MPHVSECNQGVDSEQVFGRRLVSCRPLASPSGGTVDAADGNPHSSLAVNVTHKVCHEVAAFQHETCRGIGACSRPQNVQPEWGYGVVTFFCYSRKVRTVNIVKT